MAMVSIQQVPDYQPATVAAGLERLLAPLGGMAAFVRPGERVLLKPNLLAAKAPEQAVTTHPEVVRAVIRLVQQCGAIPLVGDSPGVGGLQRVAEKSGILAVCRETGAELVEFDEPREVSGDGLFKRIALARPYLEADRLINLPKLKTHEMMTLTCGVKNLFGAVVGTAKAAWHLKAGAERERFARLLVEIHQLRPPDLTIVDAVVGMEGHGPGNGDPRQIGALLAGSDAIAVDTLAARLVGLPEKRLFVEQAAAGLGLPGAFPANISVVGTPLDELVVRDFKPPPLADAQFGLPGFLKERLRNQLTTRPVERPGACRRCGICVTACPPGAIRLEKTGLKFDYRLCIRCYCCRELCPHDALDVREGSLLRLLKPFIGTN